MAQEFPNEATFLFWPVGDPKYNNGHTAVRLRVEGRVVVLNPDDKDHVVIIKRSMRERHRYYEEDRRRYEEEMRQRNPILQEWDAHTANSKVKIPILPCNTRVWGLMCWGGRLMEIERDMRLEVGSHTTSSTAHMAELLHALGGGAYADPPKGIQFLRSWMTPAVEQWARAVRQRIEDLQLVSEQVQGDVPDTVMAEAGYQLYKPGEWKEVTKGKNFLRSQQLVRVDRLVADYDWADSWIQRLTILTKMIEAVADYLVHEGSRSEQVRTLGFQIINMMKHGGPDRSVTYTYYMSQG